MSAPTTPAPTVATARPAVSAAPSAAAVAVAPNSAPSSVPDAPKARKPPTGVSDRLRLGRCRPRRCRRPGRVRGCSRRRSCRSAWCRRAATRRCLEPVDEALGSIDLTSAEGVRLGAAYADMRFNDETASQHEETSTAAARPALAIRLPALADPLRRHPHTRIDTLQGRRRA